MPMNKLELINKLRRTEETLLIDLLGLTSDEIVDMCLDKIEENYEYLYTQVNDSEN